MAKSREQKQKELDTLNEKFSRSKGLVFANYMGLTVNEFQELRNNLKKEDSEIVVAKKSLIGLMLEKGDLDKEKISEMDSGVAVVFGYEDEVTPAKVVAEFGKKHEAISFYSGVLEGKFIDAAKVSELASLPSRQELLAKMVGSMKSPISGFANVLAGNLRGLVQVLNQIKEQKA